MIRPPCPACLAEDAGRALPRSSYLTCRSCGHSWHGTRDEIRDATTAADVEELLRPRQAPPSGPRRHSDGRFAGCSTILDHFARILRECVSEAT